MSWNRRHLSIPRASPASRNVWFSRSQARYGNASRHSRLFFKAPEGLLQKTYAQLYSAGFSRIVRDVPSEFLSLSVCLVGVFNAGGRIQILFFSAYPILVGLDEGTYACGIETIGAKGCKIRWNAFDSGRHDPGLLIPGHPCCCQPQSVADAGLGNPTVYANRRIGQEVPKSVRRLDPVKLQGPVSLRRQLDSKPYLMDGVVKAVTHPLAHFIAVVLQHHPQVATVRVAQVVVELNSQDKTAQVGHELFRRRSGVLAVW